LLPYVVILGSQLPDNDIAFDDMYSGTFDLPGETRNALFAARSPFARGYQLFVLPQIIIPDRLDLRTEIDDLASQKPLAFLEPRELDRRNFTAGYPRNRTGQIAASQKSGSSGNKREGEEDHHGIGHSSYS
jgi:hypothetical protein